METQNCQNCKQNFTIEPDDFSFYEKMKVPPPTWCPECRMVRRFAFRNERYLFRRPDGQTGKEIFSTYPAEANVKVYENSYWYGTDWDPLDTGKDYDFSKPFFEQFRELLNIAPIPTRSIQNLINSDYCNEASETKNSYLCFNIDYIENSAYLRKMNYAKDSFDSYEGTEDELCYECVMVDKSYRTFFSVDCDSCVDVWFSRGLRGCTNCFGCVNLTKKSYYFFNEPCSKKEYATKIAELNLGSHERISELKETVKKFWLTFPVKYNHTLRIVDSTGERIYDVKNVKDSYSVRESENMRYCQDIQRQAANSYDYSVWGDAAENVYECMVCGRGCYNIKFCFNCWDEVRNLDYCAYCMGCSNCFGCVGLSKTEYCILNKQYSKEEYEKVREEIINHMNEVPYIDNKGHSYSYGEFFPFDIAPLAYNQSIAQDFFPITENRAQEKGYLWSSANPKEYQTTLDYASLADDIKDIQETITQEIIKCKSCNKAYKIIPLELQFYKRIGLPIPRLCHNCRFVERFKFVNPPKLWFRSCMCKQENHSHNGICQNQFETSYTPERDDIIYCESCYQQEVN